MSDLKILDNLTLIDPNRGYWFVRTDSGNYFETFYKNGFIGIGWNQISLEDLTKLSPESIKQKIALTENYNLNLKKGKSKVTAIYNKLIHFKEIKKGDIIVIPSYSSGRLAFGKIEDSDIFIDIEKSNDCEYYKRRKVNWITQENVSKLDPKFYEIRVSRHAISNIKPYENYIDRYTNSFYFKDNFGNFTFEVKKNEDINLSQLLNLITSIEKLIKEVNQYYQYDENVEEIVIKLNLQSKGIFSLKEPVGKSLATAGLIISLFSCQKNDIPLPDKMTNEEMANANNFISTNLDTLNKIDEGIEKIEINRQKIIETFK